MITKLGCILNSRYYNPDWGRIINADAAVGQIGNIQGHNISVLYE